MLRCFVLSGFLLVSYHSHSQSYDQETAKAVKAYSENRPDSCVYFFNQAFRLAAANGSDLYNAAICNLLNGNSKRCVAFLNEAIMRGINISKLKIDPDLELLHTQKNWAKLLIKAEKVQKNQFNNTEFPEEAKQLATLWENDQYWRFRLGKAYDKKDTLATKQTWGKLMPLDSLNLIQLQLIIDRIGWPGISKVGRSGANTAFLIIDHSPRETMEKYFPLLEASARKGEASLSGYATMKDRILVNRGQKQIYGTQRYWDSAGKKFIYFPIEDESNVNDRRKEVGLEPLKDF